MSVSSPITSLVSAAPDGFPSDLPGRGLGGGPVAGPPRAAVAALAAGAAVLLPVTHVHRLSLSASLPGVTRRPVPIAARAAGTGHFVARTVGLSPTGLWRVRLALSAYGSDRHVATVLVPVR